MRTPLPNPLEDLLNRGIEVSGEAQRLLDRLSGRSLRIDPTGLPVSITLVAQGDRLRVGLGETAEVDVAVTLPGGTVIRKTSVAADRRLVVEEP